MRPGEARRPDAWLRGPVAGVAPPLMPAAHAFLQTAEDVARWAAALPPEALWERPGGAASPGFHLRHLAGSTRRLLTHARGEPLSDEQKVALALEREGAGPGSVEDLARDAVAAMEEAVEVLRATPISSLSEAREVGRARLPSTVLGLLFHAAEHAQRHAGQLATTVKVLGGGGEGAEGS